MTKKDADFMPVNNKPTTDLTLGTCCLDRESGLFHLDHFRTVLNLELARLDRWGRPLTVVLVEMPDLGGDSWPVFGRLLLDSLRRIDVAARLNERQAAVILPDADLARSRRWLADFLQDLAKSEELSRHCARCGRAMAMPWEGRLSEDLLAEAFSDLNCEESTGDLADDGSVEETETAIADDERNLLFAGFKALEADQDH